MTVGSRRFAQERGDEIGFVDDIGELSWGEINERGNRAVNGFRDVGLDDGGTVAILGGNRREFLESVGACNEARKRWVPINWHFSTDEVAYVLENSAADGIVADAAYGEVALAAAEQAGVDVRIAFGGTIDGFMSYDDVLAAASPDEPSDPGAGLFMPYTSGTTGRPKGVVSNVTSFGGDLEEVTAQFAMFLDFLGVPVDGATYLGAPLYHAGPIGFGLLPYALGSKLVLRQKWDAEEMLQLVEQHRIDHAYAVPTHFVRLLTLPEDVRDRYDLSSLKSVVHTAAPCPAEVKRQMIDWWGPVIIELYGASEGGFAAGFVCNSEEWLAHPGTVGKALPTAEVLIRDEEGNDLPVGEVGDIYVRSLLGADFEYLDDPEKTASVHSEPGVFTFGDIGYVDEDGFLYLSDRKIDMIISGGVNIYPAEIEAVLISHDSVVDASVFGVPNEEFGEEVKAAVELVPGTDVASAEVELRNLCREKLAGYMMPRSFDFGELPRTPTGKLPKRELRAKYWAGTGRSI